MPVPATVKSLDAVPEPLRALYRKDGERFVLDVTATDGLGLAEEDRYKAQIQTLQGKLGRATELMKPYEVDGGQLIDPQRLVEMLAEDKKRAKQKAEEPSQIEALTAQLRAKYDAEQAASQKQLSETTAELHRVLIDDAATTSLAKHGADVELLLPHMRKYLTPQKIDGKWVAVVVGPDGKTPLITKRQGSTDNMSMDELAGTVMRERFPAAYPATAKKGSGTQSADGGGLAMGGSVTLTKAEAQDPRKYQAARKANNNQPPTIVDG